MTAPDRIAVYWTAADEDTMPARLMAQTPRSPIFDEDLPKMQRIEYVRADLVDPAAIREAALKEVADRLALAAGVFSDRAMDTIATNPISRNPAAKATEAQLAEYDYDNMQAMLDGAVAAALRAEYDAILALIPKKGAADDRT